MKTNQIMKREDFDKIQRTKDSYFNATMLLNNYLSAQGSDKKKSMVAYKALKGTQEFLKYLKESEGIDKPIIAGRGRNAQTWMHPYLVLDFAMYLSMEFKTLVIKWVYDGLIKARHEAGDYFKEMSSAIIDVYYAVFGNKPSPKVYIKEARFIKQLVTDKKNRNEMTEKELNAITQLQKLNTVLIRKRVGAEARRKRLRDMAEALKL